MGERLETLRPLLLFFFYAKIDRSNSEGPHLSALRNPGA
jgi:hypothetical protein